MLVEGVEVKVQSRALQATPPFRPVRTHDAHQKTGLRQVRTKKTGGSSSAAARGSAEAAAAEVLTHSRRGRSCGGGGAWWWGMVRRGQFRPEPTLWPEIVGPVASTRPGLSWSKMPMGPPPPTRATAKNLVLPLMYLGKHREVYVEM